MEKLATTHTVCRLARRRLKEERTTSCKLDSETARKSTTSITQDATPLFEVREILGVLQTERQVKRL
ncbi:hypothetical protein P0D69_20990 [Paraburkholderia sediminicola]|uniref:hypothetical protein n=1 Tax=Paraburkholderia sediminicola TaxID=458836 RepID=UPI0038B7174E